MPGDSKEPGIASGSSAWVAWPKQLNNHVLLSVHWQEAGLDVEESDPKLLSKGLH